MSIEISTDRSRLDISLIHDFLSNSYRAAGRPREVVERSIKHSLCFGAYENGSQVAFARLVTDRSIFSRIWQMSSSCRIIAGAAFRGYCLTRYSFTRISKDVRLFRLATKDAHGLYAKYGLKSMVNPEKTMELFVDALE